MTHIPTRNEIELILALTPVGSQAKSNLTKVKRATRNQNRRDAVQQFVEQQVEDSRHRKLIMDDLQSYAHWESELDDA